MGLGCSKSTATIDFDSQAFDNTWFYKSLQHDLKLAHYSNVRSISVVDGCTVRPENSQIMGATPLCCPQQCAPLGYWQLRFKRPAPVRATSHSARSCPPLQFSKDDAPTPHQT
jgi:hypothetical protein